jgi:predicted NBD/HSP70 family sugar kinase
MSRSELGSETGLTRSAIRALVGELAAGGLVIEEPAVPLGTPGRPSPLVRLDPSAAAVVACEVLVDAMAAAIVALDGTVTEVARIERPRRELTEDRVVSDLRTLVAGLVGRVRPNLVGIGVAIAGVVRRSDGVVSMAPNLGWKDVPFGPRLSAAFGMDLPLAVANDADLGALAEHRRGAAVGIDDLLYISGEVGVGGGIITSGRPLTGAAGYGGEIGHLPVNPGGKPCRCGAIGCWETEVGEGALLAIAGLPPDAGRDGVETVLARAAAGDAAAKASLNHVGRWLGIGLAGLVNVFNPRLVVLGSMHGRIYPAIRATAERELFRRALPAPASQVRILPSTLGMDAPLLGAAELALEPMLADPAAYIDRARRKELSATGAAMGGPSSESLRTTLLRLPEQGKGLA